MSSEGIVGDVDVHAFVIGVATDVYARLLPLAVPFAAGGSQMSRRVRISRSLSCSRCFLSVAASGGLGGSAGGGSDRVARSGYMPKTGSTMRVRASLTSCWRLDRGEVCVFAGARRAACASLFLAVSCWSALASVGAA